MSRKIIDEPVQWWRHESKCPICGKDHFTDIYGFYDRDLNRVVVSCDTCSVKYLLLPYHLTPMWRRWGLGFRFIKEKKLDTIKQTPPAVGPFR